MNHKIVRGTVLSLALATGGCFANSSTVSETVSVEEELDSPRVVAFEAEGSVLKSGAGPIDTESTHPNGTTLGPQPDPWRGHDGEGPQPDPWLGRTKPPPPPDQGDNPSDGSNKK